MVMMALKQIQVGIAIASARFIAWLVRSLRLGAASVLPGAIARRLYPRLLPYLFDQVRRGVILVVGTNGKTTTALLLKTILTDQGYRVAHNATGANLINGLTTALMEAADPWGRLRVDYGILEVDENIIPLLLKDCHPQYILALNLFRDQLDRYGEVDVISQKWQRAIAPLAQETTLIVNGDDPTLNHLGQELAQQGQGVRYFGLSEPDRYLGEMPHAVDSIYCPRCGTALQYGGVYLSHLGDYHCPACGFAKSPLDIHSPDWGQILIGVYNKYNTLAAALLAQTLGIEAEAIGRSIAAFKAAFGRAEELTVAGKQVRILLSKNPVGMNETLRAVTERRKEEASSVTLLVLNDRIPDGTDVSWIWDVDTEPLYQLGGTLVVSGDRTYDMALRMQYSDPGEGTTAIVVEPDLEQAIGIALDRTPSGTLLHILPTYSAMLEVRQKLTGRGIL